MSAHKLVYVDSIRERHELTHDGPVDAAIEFFHGKVGPLPCEMDGVSGSFALSCGKMRFISNEVRAFFGVSRPRAG